MEKQLKSVTIENTVNAPIEKVWESYTNPVHIVKWNYATPEWHTPSATNDLRVGGKFSSRMEAKDGSMGFDFWGIYDEVGKPTTLAYTMGDGRKAKVNFSPQGKSTKVLVWFELEGTNPEEMQRGGWQAILDNFKKYTESLN